MAVRKERMSGEERRQQIIQATISVMAEQGLEGTTTRRIAENVGVSEPALYKYFSNKKALLLEALDEVGNRFFRTLSQAGGTEGEVPERIFDMSAAFYGFVMDHPEESMLFFEAVTGARDPEIKQALGDRLLEYTDILAAMFELGKSQGSVRKDLDTTVAAWQILSLGITLVFAAIIGLEKVLTRDKALLAVEEVLENIVSDAAADGGARPLE